MANVVFISGNLTRDPEIRVTANGGTILRFGIANNVRTRSNGEWTDKTGFYNVEMFGNKAAAVAKYLRKGLRVHIVGRLDYQSWTNKAGESRTAVVIIADDVETPPKGTESPQEPQYYDDADAGAYGDEIPF